MPSYRRKPFPTGQSKGITLPASMKISTEVSIASGERLVIMDTQGEVPQDNLLQFFLEYVEPAFQRWWESQKQAASKTGGIRAMEEGRTPAIIPVKPLEAEGVATPEPDVPLVSCFRCQQLIAWTIDPGATAVCPGCGAVLRLVLTSPQSGGTSPA